MNPEQVHETIVKAGGGATCTLLRKTGETRSDVTGARTPVYATYPRLACARFNFQAQEMAASLGEIQTRDFMLIVSGRDLDAAGVVPSSQDQVTVGGVTLNVVNPNIQRPNPDGPMLRARMQVRG